MSTVFLSPDLSLLALDTVKARELQVGDRLAIDSAWWTVNKPVGTTKDDGITVAVVVLRPLRGGGEDRTQHIHEHARIPVLRPVDPDAEAYRLADAVEPEPELIGAGR
jgi:hypothetical protein